MAKAAPTPAPKAPQGGIDELKYISQIYQNQYALINREMAAKMEHVKELDAAQRTLEGMGDIKNKTTMMPVGYDVYVNAQTGKGDKVVVGIGAGYLVEKTIDDAKQYLAKAMEMETKNFNDLTRAKKEVEAALIEINYKIEEAIRSNVM